MLRRWEPFTELRRMRETMDRGWPDFFFGPEGEEAAENWAIPLDVVEEDDNIVVRAAMTGVKPEDIDITVEDGVLTVKGRTATEKEHKEGDYLMRERRTGAFHRTLRLPRTVDTDKAGTTYEHGVVTITFPKLEAKKAKHLPVAAVEELEAAKK